MGGTMRPPHCLATSTLIHVGMTASTPKGRCRPCCSVAPTGMKRGAPSTMRRANSGQLKSARKAESAILILPDPACRFHIAEVQPKAIAQTAIALVLALLIPMIAQSISRRGHGGFLGTIKNRIGHGCRLGHRTRCFLGLR